MKRDVTSKTRDDFGEEVKRAVAARVGHRCSMPGCGATTSGPRIDSSKSLNLGVAAHITAAALGGPRYDPLLTPKEGSVKNGRYIVNFNSYGNNGHSYIEL